MAVPSVCEQADAKDGLGCQTQLLSFNSFIRNIDAVLVLCYILWSSESDWKLYQSKPKVSPRNAAPATLGFANPEYLMGPAQDYDGFVRTTNSNVDNEPIDSNPSRNMSRWMDMMIFNRTGGFHNQSITDFRQVTLNYTLNWPLFWLRNER